MYQNKYSLHLLRGPLRGASCRNGAVHGVKSRNPARIGLEGSRAIPSSSSLKAGLSVPGSFLVAFVRPVPPGARGHGLLGHLLPCICILTGTGLFPSIQPGSFAVTRTFDFLSRTQGMNYFLLCSRFFRTLRASKPLPPRGSSAGPPALPQAHLLPCSCSPSRGSVPVGVPPPRSRGRRVLPLPLPFSAHLCVMLWLFFYFYNTTHLPLVVLSL